MYDRLLRHELIEAAGFVALPSDTHRLLLLALHTKADDFGNLVAYPHRLLRWACCFCQIKTEARLARLIRGLCEADLVRAYDGDGRPCLHIPGFRVSGCVKARIFDAGRV